MKRISIILLVVICSTIFCFGQSNELLIDAKVPQNNGGIMINGWGSISYTFKNNTNSTITIENISGGWNAGGENYNNWSEKKGITIEPGKEAKANVITWMPPKTEKLANGETPYISGVINYYTSDTKAIKKGAGYRLPVAIAVLPSPLRLESGKYAGVELQESTWAKLNNPDKIVKYVDETYKYMVELTGNTPYNGDLMVIKECPENPYFAYAGNPIVLNTRFAFGSAQAFDNDLVDFGWVHEMGHDFDDVIGHWYNYGTFTEFQANIKLSYVVERMCKGKSKLKIKSWVDRATPLNGKEFNDEFFGPFSKKYLASDKPWTKMSSDDYHSLFHTVIRDKGWNVMKKFYATYVKLSKESKMEHPRGEERVLLALSVLNKCAGGKLAPLYQEYRIPLNDAEMNSLLKKYNII